MKYTWALNAWNSAPWLLTPVYKTFLQGSFYRCTMLVTGEEKGETILIAASVPSLVWISPAFRRKRNWLTGPVSQLPLSLRNPCYKRGKEAKLNRGRRTEECIALFLFSCEFREWNAHVAVASRVPVHLSHQPVLVCSLCAVILYRVECIKRQDSWDTIAVHAKVLRLIKLSREKFHSSSIVKMINVISFCNCR